MNKLCNIFLSQIIDEYNKRPIDENGGKKDYFNTQFFIDKYGYSSEVIDDLINTLNEYGYITKFINGDFSLNTD